MPPCLHRKSRRRLALSLTRLAVLPSVVLVARVASQAWVGAVRGPGLTLRSRTGGQTAQRAEPFSIDLRGGIEVSAEGEWLELVPAALALAAGAAVVSQLKAAVDGPPELALEPGSLQDRIILVTGGSAGLGFAAASRLAAAGATVVITARTAVKAEAAQAALRTASGSVDVHALVLDLADLSSVRAFVEDYSKQPYGGRIDVLLNNAGVMAVPELRRTEDGFEQQIGVNHLGHFALTGLLLPMLANARSYARVISVSSLAHRLSDTSGIRFAFKDGGARPPSTYSPWVSYSLSKLANVMFARELNRRFDQVGFKATAVSLHPGICATDLARYVVSGEDESMETIYARFAAPVQGAMQVMKTWLRPVERGVNTHVFLAAGADGGYACSGGQYFEDMKVAEAHDGVNDAALAVRLWDQSEQLTGVRYDFK